MLKTLAAICAVVFVLAGVPVLFLFSIERQAFNSSTYKQAFEDQRLYERMPALIAATLAGTLSQNGVLPPFLQDGTFHYVGGMWTALLPITLGWYTFLLIRREMRKSKETQVMRDAV